MTYSRILPVLSLVVLAACGGPELKINSFTASPTQMPFGGGTAALTWDVSNADSVTIDQGVGDVDKKTGTKSVPLSSNATFTLTAKAGSHSATATVTVAVNTTTSVKGTVLGFQSPFPIAGAQVQIEGHDPVVTALDGTFQIDNVTPPYDVAVGVDGGSNTGITVFEGLTLTEPTLASFTTGPTPTAFPNADVSGHVTGLPSGTYSSGALTYTGDKIISPPGGTTFNIITDAYSTNVAWASGSTASATFYALTENTATTPSQWFFGQRAVDLVESAAILNQDIAMTQVSTKSINLHFEPTVAFLGSPNLFWGQHIGSSLFGQTTSVSGSSMTVETPIVPQGQFFGMVQVGSGSSGMSVGVVIAPFDQSDVTLTLPEIPVPVAPANAATGVNGSTNFSWDALPSSVSVMIVQSSGSDPTFAIVTSGNSATLKGYPQLGAALPTSGSYTWQLIRTPRFASTNEAASDRTFAGLYYFWNGGAAGAPSRNFQFGP